MKKIISIFIVLSFMLLSCASDSDKETTENGPIEARYKVTFTSNWSAENFKTKFPDNPHISKS